MKKLFTQTSVLILFLFVMPFVCMAQVATAGDYRTIVATGNWSDLTSWEARDAGGNWATPSILPSTTSNVYIQSGHTITVDVLATCKDLQMNTNEALSAPAFPTPGKLVLAANYVEVSGKMRAYTNTAGPITGATDGAFYTQTSAVTNFSSTGGTTTTGAIRIVGNTRTVFAATEWGPSGFSNCALEFNLAAGQIADVNNAIKFKSITINSGIVNANASARMGVDDGASTGFFTIKSGAKLITLRSGSDIISASSTSKCGTITIEAGGILELGGSAPWISCTSFINNGTVIHNRAGTQTLLQRGADVTATTALNSYSTLILATTSSKSPFAPITVSNLLQFTGTATLNATAVNTLTMLNGSTVERSVTSGTSIPSTAGAIFYGTTATDLINVTIGSSIASSNEFQSAPTPGKIGTLTINPGVLYTHAGSRTVNNIVNNGQIVMTPTTSMTTTVTGIIAGSGIYSTRLSTSATAPSTIHYAASFTFTGPGPVGTLNMKQVADSNHLRSITLNSAGGLIIGNPIIVDTSLTLTNGVLTNAANLTLGTNVRISRGAGSLAAAPTFGSNIFSLVYNDVAPTTTGFELPTSSAIKLLTINNVAGVTLNNSPTVIDTLKLTLGNLTIPASQTLRISTGSDIQGAPFSSAKYIISGLSGANTGKLRIDNITSAKLFPIGTATNYLPVTVTPTSAMDYEVSVFTGATANGLPTGTPLTAAQKDRLVDAVWTINRMNGTGNCDVQTNWESILEGAAFSAFGNTSIGLARHNGTAWDLFIGTGDSTANTATATFSSFSPFLVGEVASVLPVTLKSVSASVKAAGIDINWKVENESSILKYEIEKSKNGFDFTSIGTVDAVNKSNYNFTDASIITAVFYYRIKMISTNGSYKYSYIISVKQSNNADITIYPNPVANTLIINGLKNNNAIKIVNSAGQIVLQQNANANSLSIDVSTLKTGIYAILIASENEKITSKTFIKE